MSSVQYLLSKSKHHAPAAGEACQLKGEARAGGFLRGAAEPPLGFRIFRLLSSQPPLENCRKFRFSWKFRKQIHAKNNSFGTQRVKVLCQKETIWGKSWCSTPKKVRKRRKFLKMKAKMVIFKVFSLFWPPKAAAKIFLFFLADFGGGGSLNPPVKYRKFCTCNWKIKFGSLFGAEGARKIIFWSWKLQ